MMMVEHCGAGMTRWAVVGKRGCRPGLEMLPAVQQCQYFNWLGYTPPFEPSET